MAQETPSWNRNSPSIRRIMADIRELQRDPSDQYAAKPLEDNMFDWHFVIRGPTGTDFEGGVYHGRIILPGDYPYKPPSIMLLTENGRWEVNTKICLSISAYHPEEWQPAWGIRTILEALISFMITPGEGAVGALDYTPQERRRLAAASRTYSHPCMPELPALSSTPSAAANKYQSEIAKMHIVSLETPQNNDSQDEQPKAPEPAPAPTAAPAPAPTAAPAPAPAQAEASAPGASPDHLPNSAGRDDDAAGIDPPSNELRHRIQAPAGGSAPGAPGGASPAGLNTGPDVVLEDDEEAHTDWLLYYAIALAMIIFAILYRKALHAFREQF